jgi:hypothetical protein
MIALPLILGLTAFAISGAAFAGALAVIIHDRRIIHERMLEIAEYTHWNDDCRCSNVFKVSHAGTDTL